MQRRVLGLPVLADHPPQGALNSKEFAARVIGIVVYSFVRADEEELWGVMRVIDREAAASIADGEYDSSPCVQFASPNDNIVVELEDGQKLLCEGVPSQIDHVSIVANGVWTKNGGADVGVEITTETAK